ncbi:MAG: filamentous hemagglutinin N-terminal domain-containing protein, partial [Bacteroidales bacterium]
MESFKKFSKKISIYKIAFSAIFLFSLSSNCFSQSLPEGGTVVDGSATINYTDPNTVDITIGSDKSIINWNSYNVDAGKTVNYNRDSSFISLNRVTGADPSSIFGTINATNGQIFLVNPNGIIFGSGSHVNAAGLVASTLDITNENFMKGNYEFFKVAGKNGYIVNKGIIRTTKPGGYICLFSQAIDNQGFAVADLGTVVLAAGEEITMSLDDKGTISVVISKEVQSAISDADGNRFDSAIKNSGTIQANGGKIILTAAVLNDVFDYAINNSGVIEAQALDA